MHHLPHLLALARLEELRRQARPAARRHVDRALEPPTDLLHPLTRVTVRSPPSDPCVD